MTILILNTNNMLTNVLPQIISIVYIHTEMVGVLAQTIFGKFGKSKIKVSKLKKIISMNDNIDEQFSYDVMMFFDINGCGLCNQLYSLATCLVNGSEQKKCVAVKGYYPNMTSSNVVEIDALLDLQKTNEKLVKYDVKIVKMAPKNGVYVKAEFHPPQSLREKRKLILGCFVFSHEIRQLAASLCRESNYYCLHFRLEIDVLVYYKLGMETYFNWLQLIEQNKIAEATEIAELLITQHKEWIKHQIQHYVNAVTAVCRDKDLPIIALTAIGKPMLSGLNVTMEWAFCEFEKLLAPRRIIRLKNFPSIGREHSAAVELNVACQDNCIGFIASGGSTFSATIKARIEEKKQLYTVNFSETAMLVY